jgi:hypothetical protein
MLLPGCALRSLCVSLASCFPSLLLLPLPPPPPPPLPTGSHAAGFVDHRPAGRGVGREPLPVQHRPEAVEHLHDWCHGLRDHRRCASRAPPPPPTTAQAPRSSRLPPLTRTCVPNRVQYGKSSAVCTIAHALDGAFVCNHRSPPRISLLLSSAQASATTWL